jgi:hypothetical protein
MAQESKRGCGFRRIGGLYLVGDYVSFPCDKLPFPLTVCPVCGHGVKVGLGMTMVNPLKLFGKHHNCDDKIRPYIVCDPKDEVSYIMRVGEKFYKTPEDFIQEGIRLGISKRIGQIPRNFKLGKTVIYLAFIKPEDEIAPRMLEVEKQRRVMGIFSSFIPQRIEKIFWQSTLDEMPKRELSRLKKRGITPVGLVYDKDHE